MSAQMAEKFIEALGKLEKSEDVETIVSLFADDAEIGNVTLTKNLSGADGAKSVRNFRIKSIRKTFPRSNGRRRERARTAAKSITTA